MMPDIQASIDEIEERQQQQMARELYEMVQARDQRRLLRAYSKIRTKGGKHDPAWLSYMRARQKILARRRK